MVRNCVHNMKTNKNITLKHGEISVMGFFEQREGRGSGMLKLNVEHVCWVIRLKGDAMAKRVMRPPARLML